MITTIGQIAVNRALPAELRDYSRVLDGPGVTALFQRIADERPDDYRVIAKKLSDIGREAAYTTGGFSFGLKHLSTVPELHTFREKLDQFVDETMANPAIDDDKKEQMIIEFAKKNSADLEKSIMQQSIAEKNPFAFQIKSKARGNPTNLRSLRGADILYVDHREHEIPVPVTHSYSEGLTPAEYWAGTYGARKGVFDVKRCLYGETLVLMADWTERRICDVVSGDMVMGANKEGKFVPVRVVRRYDNGLKLCHRYTFRVGSARKRTAELIATDDHEVLAEIRAGRPGSTYAYRSDYEPKLHRLATARIQKNVTKNEFVACPARGYLSKDGKHEPLALLYGLLLGDGACTGDWSLSCADGQLISDMRGYLRQFDLELAMPTQGYNWDIVSLVQHKFERKANGQIAGSGNPVWQRLTALGSRHLAHEKFIAPEVDTWKQDDVAAVIGGIFSAAGCVDVRSKSTSLRLFMTSKNLVEWVKRTLELRFGVWCGAVQYVPLRDNMRNPQWGFVIGHQECVREFAAKIPLVGVKQRVLRMALSALTPKPENLRIGFKILSKETLGVRETYDLEVDHPDHMFVLANGLVVSNSTADAGFFSKQLNQSTHRLVVTADDDDVEDEDNEFVGLPVGTDDNDSVGALLARTTGKYPRNTVITPKILQDIRNSGQQHILVRSPIAGVGPRAGGVYAKDAGYREFGRLPRRGELTGLTASQALSEKLTQGQLCLAAGTLVRMADDSVRYIEEIRAGDMVLGADTAGNTFPVLVLNHFDNGVKGCNVNHYRDDTGKSAYLVCTNDHKILGKKYGIAPAYDCTGVMPVGFSHCDVTVKFMPITAPDAGYVNLAYVGNICYLPVATYDIEVDHPDHLFVLANGLIVSNSSKHAGGVAGASGGAAVSGFKFINQLIQVPKTFRGGATHAQVDGKITNVMHAPQGGTYIDVNGERHYVPQDLELTVKPGDMVEAGDVLSNGTPNPLEVAQHKHIGEGRKYFIDAFMKAYKASGMQGHRRNVEMLARGIVDHVEMTDEMGDFNPEDIVPYSSIARAWKPREDSTRVAPKQAVGMYLDKPILHHSIGTKIKPSMLKTFDQFQVPTVLVNKNPPPFKPTMVRAMGAMNHDPDFMTRFLGSNLQKSLLSAVHTGGTSDLTGTSYVPSLVEGRSFARPELADKPKLTPTPFKT